MQSNSYIKMLNLKEFLTGGRFVKTSDIKPRAKWQFNGIIERARQINDPRTEEKIWNDTFHSIACELGIAQCFPHGYVNCQAFDHTDINTWGWDVKAFNYRFEIKYQKLGETWYSMSKTIAESIMDKFSRNGFDYIITASTRKEKDGYEIWPRLLINPKTLRKNLSRSKYDNYKPIYYNQYVAMADGDCQIYNEEIIKKLQNSEKKGLQFA